ncbi:MAG TPA: class I SAM-dependent methyltransferase [Rhodothermales bacterium]|nr:class I SAM-dependent methyltransferase [Rhodothermales bacterium]
MRGGFTGVPSHPRAKGLMQLDYGLIGHPNVSHVRTHPDHMAALGVLLGLDPVAVEKSRVLEIGCGSGANLIPMAWCFRQSEFVGLDDSPANTAAGTAAAEWLDLQNVRFVDGTYADLAAEPGTFDYIIARGIYSWVDATGQDGLLQLCGRTLSESGIAYVSYNTYPGWHQVNALRDAMRYHARDVDNPAGRASSARNFLHFLAQSDSVQQGPYQEFIQAYDRFLQQGLLSEGPVGDALILNNELNRVNQPLYFHEFIENAGSHGLQYLIDADFSSVTAENVTAEDKELLLRLSRDTVELEQYLDFLTNRSYRETLLCRSHRDVRRTLEPARLHRLLVGLSPGAVLQESGTPGTFALIDAAGKGIATGDPITCTALKYLADIAPRRAGFGDLLIHATAELDVSEWTERTLARAGMALAVILLKAFSCSPGLLRFHTAERSFASEAGARPRALPYARLQARDTGVVTNVWHERVHLAEFERTLLTLLEGNMTQEELTDALYNLDPAGTLLRETGYGAPDSLPPDRVRMEEAVGAALHVLYGSALMLN